MKKNYIVWSVVIIIIVIFIGIFAYHEFFVQKENSQPKLQINNTQQSQNQEQSINDQKQSINQISIFNTFKDEYGFQMQYSSDAKVMNAPTSKIVPCNNYCPAEVIVNGIESAYANQTINGVDYCIYSGAKNTATNSYNDYLFLTVKNNNCYGLEVSWTEKVANDSLITQSLSTIKFTK
jgi:uncharacterized protein YxeA